jgi:hypothetical protein
MYGAPPLARCTSWRWTSRSGGTGDERAGRVWSRIAVLAGIRGRVRALDLVSEVGELAKEILEGTDYGSALFEAPEGWTGELGDSLFALVCLANSTGVDLEAALNAALEKYRERLALGGYAESGR